MKLLLDAGHGGNDPGAVNTDLNLKEKDKTLEVALKIGTILNEKGHSVRFIRIDDTYISPIGRLKLINEYRPDCFISIHCNASSNPSAYGLETIYRDSYDYPLAQAVHISLLSGTDFTDRGIKNDIKDLGRKLAVLGNLEVPACLIEIGFLSNEDDVEIQKNTDNIANLIVEGIEEWESEI